MIFPPHRGHTHEMYVLGCVCINRKNHHLKEKKACQKSKEEKVPVPTLGDGFRVASLRNKMHRAARCVARFKLGDASIGVACNSTLAAACTLLLQLNILQKVHHINYRGPCSELSFL